MIEDVQPKAVWAALKSDPNAQLVDVRTDAEWSSVGIPDLTELGKSPALIEWQVYPTMQLNDGFLDQMKESGFTPEHRLYFLCRSGARSRAAARAAQEAGFPHAYNVADGFEGPPDWQGRRGTKAGWQADGLPWRRK